MEKNKQFIGKILLYIEKSSSPQIHSSPILPQKTPKNIRNALCIRPNKISSNKLTFERNFGYIKDCTILNLFIPDIAVTNKTILGTSWDWKLRNEPFIVFSIQINKDIEIKNRILVKKNIINNIILFETNQIIHVNANVKEIELFIEDSLSNPIIFPLKIPIVDFLQGTELTKE